MVKYAISMSIADQSSLSPRAARTRAALIAAGFDLLADRPIDAIPIDDVVARAGVAKGSFFNHFADKQDFAAAISAEVRVEVEALVTARNAAVSDPLERIAGGMQIAAQFALEQRRRSAVLMRGEGSSTARAHPLNRGLVADVEAALANGLLRPAARENGVLFWLALCQMLITHIVERKLGRDEAAAVLSGMLVLGLTGLGVAADRAETIAAAAARELGASSAG